MDNKFSYEALWFKKSADQPLVPTTYAKYDLPCSWNSALGRACSSSKGKMYGYAYSARLIGYGSRNPLSYPPRRIDRKLEPFSVIELLYGSL